MDDVDSFELKLEDTNHLKY